jgi:hypothetical protein
VTASVACHDEGMSFALAVVFTVIAMAAIAALLVLTLTVPSSSLCIRRRITAAVEAPQPEPAPEPRVPRDTSRPYPRPKGSRSKLNRVCPVCGTGRETGDLDRRVLAWPAHRTCAEWLGDWKPPRPTAPPFKPDRELIGYRERGRKGTVSVTVSGNNHQVTVGQDIKQISSYPIASAADLARAQEMMTLGMASVDEARERLNREIVASWGVPPAILKEHTHKVGDPLPVERCPKCGAQFVGTPDYLRSAYKVHLQLGCR